MMTAKDSISVEDGAENSSDCSVEEIPESYFKQHHHRFPGDAGSRSRVWPGDNMMRHYHHPHILPRTHYTSNLYNFAWAQAVQNKPLGFAEAAAKVPDDDDFMMDGKPLDDKAEDDVLEKEDGELEEGEIDDLEFLGERTCDSSVTTTMEVDKTEEDEDVVVVSASLPDHPIQEEEEEQVDDDEKKKKKKKNNNNNNNNKEEEEEEEEDARIENSGEFMGKKEEEDGEELEEDVENFDMRVSSVLEDLETISEEDAEKSFEGACSRLLKALENLRKILEEGRLPVLDAVIQQAFIGVETIHSVFFKGQEQNKDTYSRFLAFIKRQKPLVFASEQMKELDSMIQALGSEYVDKVVESMSSLEPKSVSSNANNGEDDGPPFSKLPTSEALVIPRVRSDFRPLLDPHVNHDEGSLPSPTRENATPSLLPTVVLSGDSATASQPSTCRQEASNDTTVLPYVTDAFRAVSSYQQKYDHISRLSNNQLPSPTPSDESNEDNGDFHGEVSSSSFVANARIGYNNSAIVNTVNSSDLGLGPHQVGYRPNPVVKASAKSRDPRLRIATSNMVGSLDFNKQPTPSRHEEPKNGVHVNIALNSGKQKSADGHTINSHSIKRQRNESSDCTDSQMSSGRGGLLEGNDVVAVQHVNSNHSMVIMDQNKLEDIESNSRTRQDVITNTNGINVGNKPAEVMNTVPDVSLPSLLKDIAVNPTMLMHLVKEQQRLAAESQQKAINSAQDATSSSSMNRPAGTAFTTDSSVKAPESENRAAGNAQPTSQLAAMGFQNDAAKLRMKPRDPRRILHNNMIRKIESLGPEHLKSSGSSPSNTNHSKDCTTVKEQGEQVQTSSPPSQPTLPPDFTCQFTKKLKNVADMMSTKPSITTPVVVPQNYSQPAPIKADGAHASQSSSSLASEVNMTSTPQSTNPWGDVGHLLDGYDEKQKAAFQRERARRIEEQSKMFASRKLCLVLDLDHTLLNSAKFAEVDQLHDEILKKKEEQDREKPQRHLFRFQHMAMWTKLRPGIWTFLEKASKLFELHLYTMGNNLYATEMAKVLDPTGTLFAGRVISKGDDSDPFDGDERAVPKSKDLEGVLGMESAVVIIDDSIRVWPHHKLNLIVVERYTYFPSSRRQFGLLGPSLLEIDHDERPEEGTLASSLGVIERIHQNFFSHPSLNSVDVRNILAAEQHKILGSCRIVFSRIFPVGEVNPHLHPLWQTAEQFGAVCTNQINDQVTHVVANSLGTDKVNWALSTGRFVVHPGWDSHVTTFLSSILLMAVPAPVESVNNVSVCRVEASALLYRRANEVDFAVKL